MLEVNNSVLIKVNKLKINVTECLVNFSILTHWIFPIQNVLKMDDDNTQTVCNKIFYT